MASVALMIGVRETAFVKDVAIGFVLVVEKIVASDGYPIKFGRNGELTCEFVLDVIVEVAVRLDRKSVV